MHGGHNWIMPVSVTRDVPGSDIPDPVIISVPYVELTDAMIRDEVTERSNKTNDAGKSDNRGPRAASEGNGELTDQIRRLIDERAHLISGYPTVYIVHMSEDSGHADGGRHHTGSSADHPLGGVGQTGPDADADRIVYVGETNDIRRRTSEHLHADPLSREDWKAFADRLLDGGRQDGPHGETDCQEADRKGILRTAIASPVRQYVIGDAIFNKSLTLDVENELMGRMLAVPHVAHLNNRRKNPQGDYYTHKDFDRLFTKIWLGLNQQDPALFPTEEVIRQSALFKASPFHRLTDEQRQAEQEILDTIRTVFADDSDPAAPTLILVSGLAGTGKTVLLSDLFYRLSTEGIRKAGDPDDEAGDDDLFSEDSSRRNNGSGGIYFTVNHNEQLNVYNAIATKLGLQRHDGELVMKPATLIRRMKERDPHTGEALEWHKPPRQKPMAQNKIVDPADVILVDEAHLLTTQSYQGYSNFYRGNMLDDLLARARVVVAVFDPHQILQSRQQIPEQEQNLLLGGRRDPTDPGSDRALKSGGKATTVAGKETGVGGGGTSDPGRPVTLPGLEEYRVHLRRLHLTRQMRMAADEKTISWIDNLIGDATGGDGIAPVSAPGTIGPIPEDTYHRDRPDGQAPATDSPADTAEGSYDLRVFASPVDLYRAIASKARQKAGGVEGHGISRLIATYDWKYVDGKDNPADPSGLWTVSMHRGHGGWVKGLPDGYPGYDADHPESSMGDGVFCLPWNYQIVNKIRKQTAKNRTAGRQSRSAGRNLDESDVWAEEHETINEVGSTYTIQGFDLNYAGVILGKSIGYEGTYPTGRVVFHPCESSDGKATVRRGGKDDYARQNLRNQLNVLLKRGVHGLYLFALDHDLEEALRQAALPNGKWVPEDGR